VDAWLASYASVYNAAYDVILAQQSEVKVLASFEHSFDTAYDRPAASSPLLSVKTFIRHLVPAVGQRKLRLAFHPYAPNLFSPVFSAEDLPDCTYGNIGVLLGWLAQEFPNRAELWGEVQCTESGISSAAPQSDATRQANAICLGFRNLLGTPGIHNYVYHRMQDNKGEGGLLLGLVDVNGNYKPSWATWALANRPGTLNCGFEYLPYTKLERSYNRGTAQHWASTRMAPAGFVSEQAWKLLRNEQPGTVMLWECQVGTHNMLTRALNCEGQLARGPVGFVYTSQVPNTVPLYRCSVAAGRDHFVSPDSRCEGQVTEQLLGYVVPL
jgi:hypothetical protein